jgi:hypothetical protein
MAAVAFDSLHYAHQLEAAGMPRAQAEVIAQGLTAMFVHNFDSLVTKDYLDTRFSEQSIRMELLATAVDGKLELLSANMDSKLSEMDGKLDLLSVEMDSKLSLLSSNMDSKLSLLSSEIDGKLGKLYVMFGVIMAGLAIPIFQILITWLA